MRRVLTISVLALLTTFVASSLAQVSTGIPPFGSFGGGPFDTVNLGNLNVHFAIPVLNKAGRGTPFSYSLGYDSSVWAPVTSSGVTSWAQNVSNWGWSVNSNALGGSYTTKTFNYHCVIDPGPPIVTQVIPGPIINSFTDPSGTVHKVLVSEYAGVCDTSGPDVAVTTNDGSGWTVTYSGSGLGVSAKSRSGITVVPNVGGTSSFTDQNGNILSANASGQYFDTLSSTVPVLTQTGSATPTSPTKLTFTPPSGGSATYTVNYTQYTVITKFGVPGINEYGPLSQALVSSISLPDNSSYQFTYESFPTTTCTPIAGTYANCVTARIASVILPTGGTIAYSYSGGSNGIESDGSAAGLTRSLTPGGPWQYTRTQVLGAHWQTQITSPPDPVNSLSASDVTVIDFQEDGSTSQNFYETQRQVKQGASTVLAATTRCYNTNYMNCTTPTSVSAPITQIDIYSATPTQTRASEIQYNSYGLVTSDAEYGYGVTVGAAPPSTSLVKKTSITYAALTNGIVDRPSSVKVQDYTTGTAKTIALTSYGYDETGVTGTSGTPQLSSISGSRGNVTTVTTSTSATTSISSTLNYYDTGNPNSTVDVNGVPTTYVYGAGSCGNSFATTINEPQSLSRLITWDCTGGVATKVTDESGNYVTTNYTDPNFWRPANVYDQQQNETKVSYTGQNAVETALQNFNGGNSVTDSLTTVDGFGRVIFNQNLQGPGSTNYDTYETDYDIMGQSYRTTMPYVATASPSSSNTTAPSVNTTYDALGRPLSIADALGGTVSYTYSDNDVLQKTTGTQAFQKQFEYDGLGRLTSVCEISSTLPGVGACGQTTAKTGLWTKYTYDALGHLLSVTQNAQATSGQQARSFVYDWMGRMTSETNPESGMTTYTYDTIASPGICGGYLGTPGDLLKVTKADGSWACYFHDGLHRVTDVGNSNQSTTNACKRFRYDNTLGVLGSIPSGVTIANTLGRLAEAETDSCGSPTTPITDEWFSYSPRGELTDVYEKTPHSVVYYHTTAAYWQNGALKTLSGIPGVPTLNYGGGGTGLDGEGRYTKVTAATGTNPVTAVTYSTTSTADPLGSLLKVTFGSADFDSFTYNPKSGRMATYTFSVNSATDKGTLTWNTNGTLKTLAIVDGISGTSDTQTCNYVYDDAQRVSSANCGTPWSQTFTYDSFGNISKSGSSSFSPTYSSSTNRFTSIPGVTVRYDANGELLTDNLNTYTWNVFSNPVTVNSTALTYDAFGQMVEQQNGSSYTEILYSPVGKTALMNGQTLSKAFVYLPGGATAIYNSTGLAYYRHSDWLGSSRLTSTQARAMYSSSAYAPFGEQYKVTGTSDASFTGQNADTATSLYDFTFREHSSSQGRWISPDPAGVAAVDPTNPQSWNRYAYAVNNSLALVDPLGLKVVPCPPGSTSLICVDVSAPGAPDPELPQPGGVNSCWDPAAGGFGACPVGAPPRQTEDCKGFGCGDGGSPSIAMAVIPPEMQKNCRDQLADMLNLINAVRGSNSGSKGLAQRFSQILRGNYANVGHIEQFQNRQTQLQSKIDNYRNSGCGDPPASVTSWAAMPVASPWTPQNSQNFSIPSWVVPAAVITGATACAVLVPGCLEVEGAVILAP